jgi:predicted transcriptional regulator
MTVEFNRRTYDRLGAVADAEEMSKAAVVRQAVRDLCDRKEAAEARRKTRESDTGVVESGTDTTTSRGGAQDDAPEDR